MIRWKSVLLGAITFLAAHAVESAAWTTWFRGVYAPWFLNSGRALAFTAGSLVIIGLVVGINTAARRESTIAAGNFLAGAIAAMIVVLFAVGPGTLFPIAIIIGAAVLGVSSAAGVFAGSALRSGLSRSSRA
jgi:uncharacterized membrane protein